MPSKKKFKLATAAPAKEPKSTYRHMSLSTEKISNGWLSRMSHDSGDDYKTTTTFHRSDPSKHKRGPHAIMAKRFKMVTGG